ncbi:MAG: aminotransferase class I/II-fold pyridoxal phosphate-dependent enzyme [Pseudomonadota bacterium]
MRNARRSRVDPFIVMDVMEAARAAEASGRDIVHMEVGQPGTPAPRRAREALAAALDQPLGYTVSLGLPALRERIARLYREWYDVAVPAERVIVTAGASGAFTLAFLALFDAGDRVAVGDPGYPSYRNILRALDLTVDRIETQVAARYQPTPGDVHGGLDGLLIASPANPTGSMLDRGQLGALVEACRAHDVALISDEIYHGLHYGDRAVSALELSEDAIVVNSFSKYFSMTGWRIGWMVVPEGLVRTVERLAQNLFICPPHASQIAALAALDATEELEANRAVYAANRARLLEALPALGFADIAPPDGAFYIYADIGHLTDDSRDFTRRMLGEAGVAATPGHDFDPVRGATTLRFSYAETTERIEEGIRRLTAWRQGNG